MSIEEIKEFVQGELTDLNLSTEEQENYINFIKNAQTYYEIHNIKNIDMRDRFIQKLEDCIEFFKIQGFDDSTSLQFAKVAILDSNRKNLKEKLSFLRIINLEESVIMSNSLSLRFNIEKAHAKKMHLVAINNKEAQTRNFLLHDGDDRVKKRLNVEMTQLIKKYPLTKETRNIWAMISTMNNQQFTKFFNMTREELSYIYPTTREEIATLHFIATMKDEEIKSKYGITRQEILQKYPLNNDTLKALRSINQSTDKAIQNTLDKTREEVLKLRTITTEMIRIAKKERISLKQNNHLKKETNNKTLKKGTNPNG